MLKHEVARHLQILFLLNWDHSVAANVVWLDQAKDDVHQFLEYLHPKIPSAALAYVDDLERACSGLADFPLQGFQYNEQYRALVVRNHLVFYRYNQNLNEVVIVLIIDGRRDIPRFFSD